jgi:hypothetical protein
MREYTDEQVEKMGEAFDLVADKGNWKNRINAVVPADADIAVIEDAVAFYAGCLATCVKLKDGRWRVTAPGYYMSVGS